jgi:hypothetical protein
MQDTTSVLLFLEPMSAVLARVAYRVIEREYRARPCRPEDGRAFLVALCLRLGRDGLPVLSCWIAAYGWHNRRGRNTAQTKQWIVRRARWAAMNRREGKPWACVPGQ